MCKERRNLGVFGWLAEIFCEIACVANHLVKRSISGIRPGSMAPGMVYCVAIGGVGALRIDEDLSKEGVLLRDEVVAWLLVFGFSSVQDSVLMWRQVSLGCKF